MRSNACRMHKCYDNMNDNSGKSRIFVKNTTTKRTNRRFYVNKRTLLSRDGDFIKEIKKWLKRQIRALDNELCHDDKGLNSCELSHNWGSFGDRLREP